MKKLLVRLPIALAAVFVLVAVCLLAIVATLGSIDLDQYRDQVAEQVHEATGRELVLKGEIKLSISLHPLLTITDASFANASWGSRPQMLKFQRLEAQVALLPLLRGDIDLKRVLVKGADLLLETDGKGGANWHLEGLRRALDEEQESVFNLALLREGQLENVQVTHHNVTTGEAHSFHLAKVILRTADATSQVKVELQGSVDSHPIQVVGEVTRIKELLAGNPYSLALNAQITGSSIEIAGTIERPHEGAGLDLSVTGSGANLASLSQVIGTPLPSLGPFRFSFRLSDTSTSEFLLNDLDVLIGKSDVKGRLIVTKGKARPRLDAQLLFKTVDLREIMAAYRSEEPRARKKKPAGGDRKEQRVFGRETLPWHLLKVADADLSLRMQKLATGGLAATDVSANIALHNGKLKVKQLQFRLGQGLVQADVLADAGQSTPRVSLDMTANQLEVGQLLQHLAGTDVLEEGKIDAAIKLRGRGRSIAGIMASLDGETSLLMGKGRARIQAFDALVGGVTKVLGTTAAKDSQSASINCAASDFDINRGIATSRVMFTDTEFSIIYGKGDIDLGTEKLNLEITPKPKSTTLNMAVPVDIGGTLANPSFTPDKLATARKTVGIVAVVSTIASVVFPPLAIVGLAGAGGGALAVGGLGALGSDENPCLDIIASKTGKATPEVLLAADKSPSQRNIDGVGID